MISSSLMCCLCLHGANYNSGSVGLSVEARTVLKSRVGSLRSNIVQLMSDILFSFARNIQFIGLLPFLPDIHAYEHMKADSS